MKKLYRKEGQSVDMPWLEKFVSLTQRGAVEVYEQRQEVLKDEAEGTRYHSSNDFTLGMLFEETEECKSSVILEDEYRENKVSGETRIPDGTQRSP